MPDLVVATSSGEILTTNSDENADYVNSVFRDYAEEHGSHDSASVLYLPDADG